MSGIATSAEAPAALNAYQRDLIFGSSSSPLAGAEPAIAAALVVALATMAFHRVQRARAACGPGERRPESCGSGGFEEECSRGIESNFAGAQLWQTSENVFCPVCRSEYLYDTAVCEDCGTELVEEEELPETDVRIQESIVRIARLDDSFHGLLIRNVLSSNRIPCSVDRSLLDVGGANVYVFESDAVRAKRLLRSYFGLVNSA